jgi:Protein of unknown function (DUF3800)
MFFGAIVNALLRHVWGKSLSQDRVWSHVTGLAPDRAVRRLLMALSFQAFVDESYSADEFVLGGNIASAEQWASFARAWEELLPLAGKSKSSGNRRFKMKEFAANPLRMEHFPKFYRVLEDHASMYLSFRINLPEFRRALERAQSFMHHTYHSTLDFKKNGNPYYFSVVHLLKNFHKIRPQLDALQPLDAKVDFIFDKNSEEDAVLSAWADIVSDAEDFEKYRYGRKPRFEDDEEFLPLQAADLWAWWVRNWYETEIDPDQTIRDCDFGTWRGRRRRGLVMSMSENDMTDSLQLMGAVAWETLNNPSPD